MAGPGLRIGDTTEATVAALAGALVRQVARAVQRRGSCRVALAGGSTPRALYRLLESEAWRGKVEWGALELFWGDERCVPADDEANNARMAFQALLDHVPVPAEQVHTIDGSRPAAVAAAEYAAQLGDDPLDVVLLGMGGDGHTASLFPGTAGLRQERRAVVAMRSPVPPVERVTLTLHTLARARIVLFLVTGEGKAARVAQVMAQLARPLEQATLPAAMVRPDPGALRWYLDGAAAARLPREARG
jgi:6-phosphogluconolactonase